MASARLRESALKSPRQLYKFLLRECERLPKEAQGFYRHSVKQVNSISIFISLNIFKDHILITSVSYNTCGIYFAYNLFYFFIVFFSLFVEF